MATVSEAPSANTLTNGKADTISRVIARFAHGLRYEDIPSSVVERAKLHILDAIGIAFASSTYDFARRSMDALLTLSSGDQPVIAHRERLSLRDSATMNGILIHGLDYDDTHMAGVIHVTASALPLALGECTARHLSGRDLLLGYLIAVEVGARVGAVAKGAFHEIGFHPTGLVGAFGCATAAARLEGLSVDAITLAQGLVGSMAAGSMEFLETGAWNKRLHPGWAAACGITASRFAGQGFVATETAYEGRFGLFAAYLRGRYEYDVELATRGLGSTWELANVGIKPYPACHFVHAFADAILELRRRDGLRAEDVASIRCLIAQGEVATVCEPWANKLRPASEYDAKFSLPFVVAASLVRARFSLAELQDDALSDPVILALAQLIRYEPDPDSAFPTHYSGEVIVQRHDGRTLRQREQINRGTTERPLTHEDIERKFMDNMTLRVSRERGACVRDAVLGLDKLEDAAELAELLTA